MSLITTACGASIPWERESYEKKKAPDPDGIPAQVYKVVFHHRPKHLLVKSLKPNQQLSMSFFQQFKASSDKAAAGVSALSLLIESPTSSRRRLLMNVMHYVLLYGAAI